MAASTTPAIVIVVGDHVWSIGELLDAALATQTIDPVVTAPDRCQPVRTGSRPGARSGDEAVFCALAMAETFDYLPRKT